jgi:hypothetical protein
MDFEGKVGAALAEQMRQIQEEGNAFSPVNAKLQEAQNRLLEGFLSRSEPRPVHPLAGNEDFAWIVSQLQSNPLVIPYFRKYLEAVLVQLKADIEASLAKSLGQV